MHKWVCFQSNQEGHQTPTNCHLRTCELWSQRDMDESLYANLGPAMPMTFIVFLVFVCFYMFFLWVGGGVKGWSTAASVKHTHAHTFCTHRLPRQRTSAWSLQTARANNLCLLAALQTNLHREKCTSQRSLLEDGGGGGEGGHLCNFCRYILFNGETVSVI